MAAMATKTRTFEELLGEGCLRSILLKVEETMMRVNCYSSGHQVDMMHADIVSSAKRYIDTDPRLGRVMAAAFCEAVTAYYVRCDKHGNVTAEMVEPEAIYDDIRDTDANVTRIPLEVHYEDELEKLVEISKISPAYYLDILGLTCG